MIIRCPKCNKMLFKIELNGYMKCEIKCPRCKCQSVSSLETNEYNNKNKKRAEDSYGRSGKGDHSRWD
ncbi:hypothetical protein [uncultured Clostridium sp.]|uniref:hypothetical protein n=1 Tax=uncultured Clostridium sp. TaxID=59620 RepID=UPI002611AED4|nr:hypothetical protein [uncultured Clostridium sp.]